MSTANLAALKTAWLVEVAKISDALVKAEATQLVDEYIDARTAVADLESGKVQSYSIGGRSFTYHTIGGAQRLINELQRRLGWAVYGRTTLVDANVETGNEQ